METLRRRSVAAQASADLLGPNLLTVMPTPTRHRSARSHLRETPLAGATCCSLMICRLEPSSADTPGERRFVCLFFFPPYEQDDSGHCMGLCCSLTASTREQRLRHRHQFNRGCRMLISTAPEIFPTDGEVAEREGGMRFLSMMIP